MSLSQLSQPAVGRRVATVTRTVSASKSRASRLGSGLKATSLLNIFMHSQQEQAGPGPGLAQDPAPAADKKGGGSCSGVWVW